PPELPAPSPILFREKRCLEVKLQADDSARLRNFRSCLFFLFWLVQGPRRRSFRKLAAHQAIADDEAAVVVQEGNQVDPPVLPLADEGGKGDTFLQVQSFL